MIYKCTVLVVCAVISLVAETEGTEKTCRVRESTFPREIWNHWTGYYCYTYTNDYRLNFKYKIVAGQVNNYQIPASLANGTIFWYDYLNATALQYIRISFRTEDYFTLWKSCCQEAVECCDNVMTEENIIGSSERCPAIWDGWTCFEPVQAGSIEKKLCSKQAYSTMSEVCELKSEKECFDDGTWNQNTSYASCAMAPVLRKRHNFNVIALAIATAISFPSVVIFFSFRKFRNNLRLILHRNLLLIIIIRNLYTIMTKEIIILDALKVSGSNNVMEDNSVACRILAFFENAAKNGMYACMLADGFYLHKLIVRVFADDPDIKFIYGTLLGLTFVPSLIWAIKRGASKGEDCWMVDYSHDQWITDGFRIAILSINCLLLLDIIRVMIWKMKRGKNTPQQTKAALRASLFLLPLFGIHIFVISDRNIVPNNTCLAEDIYYYISYLMEGLQGVMVALLFCYLNTEVQEEIRNALRKFYLYFQSRFGNQAVKANRRRTTATTFA